MKSKVWFLFCILFLSFQMMAQTVITGKVIDEKGEPVPLVSLLVKIQKEDPILAFATTNFEGEYTLKINNTSDSLWIESQVLNYKKQFIRIQNKSQQLNFTLKEQIFDLENVVIKAKEIEERGDTISYLISALSRQQDRSLGEVLKHIPGIEVKEGGRIFYDGLPLKKFYVEGLDMMKGRYGVITENLPHEAVSTVEVLKHHQPIEMLRDKVFEEQASLNVKLKNNVAMTGTGKVGTGFKPLLWEVNLTPMIFTKKYQFLLSYQTNNVGKPVEQQMNILTIDDLNNPSSFNNDFSFLSLKPINKPFLDNEHILDNNIHFLNINGLTKLKKNLELNTSIYYINDYQQEYTSEERNIFLSDDTLTFVEENHHRIFKDYIVGDFNFLLNTKNNYLKNKLSLKSSWDKMKGFDQINQEDIYQLLDKPSQSISNKFKSIRTIGKNTITFHSQIAYDDKPHKLKISPGQFPQVLNNTWDSKSTHQHVNMKRFFTDNSAIFGFSLNRFMITPQVGISYINNDLNSYIYQSMQDEDVLITNQGFENNLKGEQLSTYLKSEIQYKKGDFSATLKLPFEYLHVSLKDTKNNADKKLNTWVYKPSLSIYYKFSFFWKISSGIKYSEDITNIEKIHYAYILKSYGYLNQNNMPLSKIKSKSIYGRLIYDNVYNGLSGRIMYRYDIYDNNIMIKSKIKDDGTSVNTVYELPNQSTFQFGEVYLNKHFYDIESNLSINVTTSIRNGEAIVNDELVETENITLNIKPSANIVLTNWCNIEYSFNSNFISNRINNKKKGNIKMYKHEGNVYIFPTDKQTITLSSEYYNYEETHNLFANLTYRYTLSKPKMDLELTWNNIFNNEYYISYQTSAYTFWKSKYQLRPSQLLASIRFSF